MILIGKKILPSILKVSHSVVLELGEQLQSLQLELQVEGAREYND